MYDQAFSFLRELIRLGFPAATEETADNAADALVRVEDVSSTSELWKVTSLEDDSVVEADGSGIGPPDIVARGRRGAFFRAPRRFRDMRYAVIDRDHLA